MFGSSDTHVLPVVFAVGRSKPLLGTDPCVFGKTSRNKKNNNVLSEAAQTTDLILIRTRHKTQKADSIRVKETHCKLKKHKKRAKWQANVGGRFSVIILFSY